MKNILLAAVVVTVTTFAAAAPASAQTADNRVDTLEVIGNAQTNTPTGSMGAVPAQKRPGSVDPGFPDTMPTDAGIEAARPTSTSRNTAVIPQKVDDPAAKKKKFPWWWLLGILAGAGAIHAANNN